MSRIIKLSLLSSIYKEQTTQKLKSCCIPNEIYLIWYTNVYRCIPIKVYIAFSYIFMFCYFIYSFAHLFIMLFISLCILIT